MAIGDKSYNLSINDSEFEREGWKRSRYKGSKLIGAKINKFTEGDTTFARQPVIEQYSKTVYVFNQANHSFNTNAGVFYPNTDEFNQTLEDKTIVGSTRFKIDRAVTFTIGNPRNFSQIEPGVDENSPSYHYFDTLLKKDLSLFNSCSVKFFDNVNNGFIKPHYNVTYNKGDFSPAAAYFQSASTATGVHATSGEDNFDYGLSDNAILYINPNVENWFISQNGASGSLGTLNQGLPTPITIDHLGNENSINSVEGYFHRLSSRLSPTKDSYYISFHNGTQGPGILNEKNLIKAFDIHELDYSGSNINLTNNEFKIKTSGRFGDTFKTSYDGAEKEEFVLFREKKSNNTVHLDFNLVTEAPAGVGNGGVIIPENLHPAIKESLNVYLGNAGLGAQGGTTAQFGLGGAVQSTNTANRRQQNTAPVGATTGRIGFQGSGVEEQLAPTARAVASNQTSLQYQSILNQQALTEAATAQQSVRSLGTEVEADLALAAQATNDLIAGVSNDITLLSSDIAGFDAALTADAQQRSTDLSNLETTLVDQISTATSDLSSTLTDTFNLQISDLTTQYQEFTELSATQRETFESGLDDIVTGLQADYESSQLDYSTLTSQISDLTDQYTEFTELTTAQRETFESSIADDIATQIQTETQGFALASEYTALQGELDTFAQDVETFQANYDNFASQLQTLQADYEAIEATQEDLRETVDDDIASLQDEINQIEQDLQAAAPPPGGQTSGPSAF